MTHPCPKCSRILPQSGEAVVDDRSYPVYQCDECLMTADVCGENMEIALTFAIGDDGKPFDPATPDGRLSF
jgi:hypothetical protein